MPPTPQTTETQGGGGRPPKHTPRRLIQSERGRESPFAPSEPRQEDGGGGCPPEPGPPPAPQNGVPSRSSRAPRAPGPHCAQNLTPRRCSRNPPAPAPTSNPPGRASCGRRTTWLSHLGGRGTKHRRVERRGGGVQGFTLSVLSTPLCLKIVSENVEKKRSSLSWNQISSLLVENHLAHTNPRPRPAERPFPWADPGWGSRSPQAGEGSVGSGEQSAVARLGAPALLPERRGARPSQTNERAALSGPQAAARGAPLSPHPTPQRKRGFSQKPGLLVEARDSEPRPGRAARP